MVYLLWLYTGSTVESSRRYECHYRSRLLCPMNASSSNRFEIWTVVVLVRLLFLATQTAMPCNYVQSHLRMLCDYPRFFFGDYLIGVFSVRKEHWTSTVASVLNTPLCSMLYSLCPCRRYERTIWILNQFEFNHSQFEVMQSTASTCIYDIDAKLPFHLKTITTFHRIP